MGDRDTHTLNIASDSSHYHASDRSRCSGSAQYARDMCQSLGVRGWIKLTNWGTVVGQLQGEKEHVDQMQVPSQSPPSSAPYVQRSATLADAAPNVCQRSTLITCKHTSFTPRWTPVHPRRRYRRCLQSSLHRKPERSIPLRRYARRRPKLFSLPPI